MNDEQKQRFCKLVIRTLIFLVGRADVGGFAGDLVKELNKLYYEL